MLLSAANAPPHPGPHLSCPRRRQGVHHQPGFPRRVLHPVIVRDQFVSSVEREGEDVEVNGGKPGQVTACCTSTTGHVQRPFGRLLPAKVGRLDQQHACVRQALKFTPL